MTAAAAEATAATAEANAAVASLDDAGLRKLLDLRGLNCNGARDELLGRWQDAAATPAGTGPPTSPAAPGTAGAEPGSAGATIAAAVGGGGGGQSLPTGLSAAGSSSAALLATSPLAPVVKAEVAVAESNLAPMAPPIAFGDPAFAPGKIQVADMFAAEILGVDAGVAGPKSDLGRSAHPLRSPPPAAPPTEPIAAAAVELPGPSEPGGPAAAAAAAAAAGPVESSLADWFANEIFGVGEAAVVVEQPEPEPEPEEQPVPEPVLPEPVVENVVEPPEPVAVAAISVEPGSTGDTEDSPDSPAAAKIQALEQAIVADRVGEAAREQKLADQEEDVQALARAEVARREAGEAKRANLLQYA